MNHLLPVEIRRSVDDSSAPGLYLAGGVDPPSHKGWMLPGNVRNAVTGWLIRNDYGRIVVPMRDHLMPALR